ncbi:MAG: type II toxin-antitoxin system HipA family toxin [Balneolaceae bacterium]|nr:MAG: type II toxin-antitoxin system HipA family toxin [Balneolaceae bacterium]
MNRCLICAEQTSGENQYHSACLVDLFGKNRKPLLDYELNELSELAKKVVLQKVTIPGVQAKLSLEIDRQTKEANKLTIVGLLGSFILKPPSKRWPELPENEHATLLMAKSAGIETVPFGLVRLKSGEPAFITRRIDRHETGLKFAMEDMCQLSERLSEDKYKGSHEQVAKLIKKFTENPMFDLSRYFELVLFCFLTGNSDMHLKNFSLFKDPNLGWKLSPAYDLLSTRLVIPENLDPEDLALTLGGKKRKFTKNSFPVFGKHIGLNEKQIENIFEKMKNKKEDFEKILMKCFLSDELKERYSSILQQRREVLGW